MKTLRGLSDEALLAHFRDAVERDNRCCAEVLRAIDETDRRELWAVQAHSSMFDYCVRQFGMSDGVAGNRIAVARLARRFPLIFEPVARGDVHLTGLLRLRPHLTDRNFEDILTLAKGKSVKEIERLVAEVAPQPDVPSTLRALPKRKRESSTLPSPEPTAQASLAPRLPFSGLLAEEPPPKRAADPAPLAPRRYKLQVTIDEETHGQLGQLQDLLAHQISDGDPAVIVKRALGVLLEQTLKKKAALTKRPRQGRSKSSKRKRAIPAALKREVWHRDEGRCAFVSDAGRRCNETRGLEYAHAKPWALGGEHTAANVALRCLGHNGYEANRDYGATFMKNKRKRRDGVRERLAVYATIAPACGASEAMPRVSRPGVARAPPRRGN